VDLVYRYTYNIHITTNVNIYIYTDTCSHTRRKQHFSRIRARWADKKWSRIRFMFESTSREVWRKKDLCRRNERYTRDINSRCGNSFYFAWKFWWIKRKTFGSEYEWNEMYARFICVRRNFLGCLSEKNVKESCGKLTLIGRFADWEATRGLRSHGPIEPVGLVGLF